MLLPLYLLRAAVDRNRARVFLLACLAAGTAIAALFFVPAARSIGTSPLLLGAIIFEKHLVIPLLPFGQANDIGRWLTQQFASGARPLWPTLLAIGAFALLCRGAIRTRSITAIWLVMAGAILAGGGYLGALNDKLRLLDAMDGGRYAFAPQVLFSLACVPIAIRSSRMGKVIWSALIGYVLCIQLYDMQWDHGFDQGPSWPAEVARFARGEVDYLSIWPRGWEIVLPRPVGR